MRIDRYSWIAATMEDGQPVQILRTGLRDEEHAMLIAQAFADDIGESVFAYPDTTGNDYRWTDSDWEEYWKEVDIYILRCDPYVQNKTVDL